jgi:hypothetical protein
VGRICRLLGERLDDDRFDVVVSDRTRYPRPALIGKALQTLVPKALAPLADRHLVDRELRGDLVVPLVLGAGEHEVAVVLGRIRR